MAAPDPHPTTDLSVIVVNYNTRHLLDEMMYCLEAAAQGLTVQVIIVDNASADRSAAYIRSRFPKVELIENERNVGFGRANNQAVPLLKGRYVLLLNTDAFMAPNALQASLACMERHPRCGIVGLKLVGRDGELQPSCRYFPTPWNVFLQLTGLNQVFRATRLVDDMAWGHDEERECDWVTGCFYLIRREVLNEVGLFDPRFFLYCEEVDHCRRTRHAGWQVLFCPDAQVIHIGGESAKTEAKISSQSRQIPALQVESELLYFRKHYGLFGVLMHVSFGLLSSAILSVKGLVKRRSLEDCRAAIGHLTLVIRSVVHTGWGLHPTR